MLGLFALAIGAHDPAYRGRHHRRDRLRARAGAADPADAQGRLGSYIHAYLPTEAGQLIGQAHQLPSQVLSPWQGFGVFCLWTAVLFGIALWLLIRRDA